MFKVPEKYRAKFEPSHPYYSDEKCGNNGVFQITDKKKTRFNTIASDQELWEHVSVTIYKQSRTPTWEEMCFIKDLFWSDDQAVVQYHPAKEDYRNHHPYCLHLWRPVGVMFPVPPPIMVAP